MRTIAAILLLMSTGSAIAGEPESIPPSSTEGNSAGCAAWLDQRVPGLRGAAELDLCALTAGKAVLFVNTASFCGYTPQFTGLEALHQRYRDEGLVVIGFPSDDFLQESEDAAETANICYVNYGVTFPMSAEIKVRGADAHPLFRDLHAAGQPSWNFNKYLVGRDGNLIRRFGSNTDPDAPELIADIQQALGSP